MLLSEGELSFEEHGVCLSSNLALSSASLILLLLLRLLLLLILILSLVVCILDNDIVCLLLALLTWASCFSYSHLLVGTTHIVEPRAGNRDAQI